MRKLELALLVALFTTALTAGLPTAGAKPKPGSTCTGTLASGSYKKLVVPAGAMCDGTLADIDVRGGVRVGEGATFILGEDGGGDTGKIRGGVRANDAESLQLHFADIKGGVKMLGGEGFFSTVEDNVIHGRATIDGYTGFWLGFIRNTVHGTVKLTNNVLEDDDANEYVTNTIKGNLVCHNNSPAPQVGDSQGLPNVVTGQKVDQCDVPGL
jgi:hypothetical protein